eukprot:5029172-Pyramimonas_sp.AAC.1
MAKTTLSTVTPSKEELAKAREILAQAAHDFSNRALGVAGISRACRQADGKELASKKQSMKHFLLSNPDAAASSAKGATKMAFLEKFLVHQLRCKDTEKKSLSEKTKKTSNITYNDVQWMSQDKMDAELGEAKAKHWRECGKLRSRPDRLTGSTDPLL